MARRLLEGEGLDPARADEVVDAGRRFDASGLGRRVARSGRGLAEIPVGRWREDARLPTLLRGKIDLAFREEAGWVLVDHKTHPAADEGTRRDLVEHFRPQLDAYASAWSAGTGESVVARGLWFTGPGVWRALEDPAEDGDVSDLR